MEKLNKKVALMAVWTNVLAAFFVHLPMKIFHWGHIIKGRKF